MAESKKEAKQAKEEPKAASAAVDTGKPKSKLPVVIGMIAGIVVLQVALTLVAVRMLKPADPEVIASKVKKQLEEQERAKQTEMGKTSPPMSIIVNLAGPDANRFLKTELVLEYKAPEAAGGEGGEGGNPEIEARKPKLKDIAIGILTSCTYDDLKDLEGKKKILERLKAEMNKYFPEPETIRNVYFDGFVIQ